MCMLWAGATVCQLMLRDDPASRLFSGSLALLFLVLAWLKTRLLLLGRRLRTILLPCEKYSALLAGDSQTLFSSASLR